MRYPKLREIAHDKQYIDTFGGYNHNVRIGDGEFYDVVNMTSDAFPLLKVREPHGVFKEGSASGFDGMISKNELCYVAGGEFFMGDAHVDLQLTSSVKTLVSMGAYVIIFPDKKYVNTADLSDYGNIAVQVSGNSASIRNCTGDGTLIPTGKITISDTKPENGENGWYWINTSTTPATMFRYSGESGQWFDVKGYIRIDYPATTDELSAGDSVRLDGFYTDTYDFDGYQSISAVGKYNNQIAGSTEIIEMRYVVIPGVLADTAVSVNTEFSISRDAPDMDFVIEANNRLWGCKYGYTDGKLVNEIYASKLGDFRNWHNYAGISTDSYAASVGTDGPFTGAVNYGGYPLFFKERYVHKVYGSMPSSFQIQTDTVNGVQEGCAKSLAVVNEVLYYKSRSGVCAYDGSMPTVISEKLGSESYGDAVGGGHQNKYFITMRKSGISYDFIYDTSKGIWHRSQIPQRIEAYCSHKGEMYFMTNPAFDGSFIGTMYGQEEDSDLAEKKVYWSAESGMIGLYTNDKKSLASISVRIKVALGTRVRFYIEYDSSGCWEPVCAFVGTGIKVVTMPIIPRRCDHFRIKIEGEGPATLFSICKTIEEGTEL